MYTGNYIPALKPRLNIVCSYYPNQSSLNGVEAHLQLYSQ